MATIGEGWLSLTRELEDETRLTDPDAAVSPTVAASGLLRLQIKAA
jgi:hypothetical protein